MSFPSSCSKSKPSPILWCFHCQTHTYLLSCNFNWSPVSWRVESCLGKEDFKPSQIGSNAWVPPIRFRFKRAATRFVNCPWQCFTCETVILIFRLLSSARAAPLHALAPSAIKVGLGHSFDPIWTCRSNLVEEMSSKLSVGGFAPAETNLNGAGASTRFWDFPRSTAPRKRACRRKYFGGRLSLKMCVAFHWFTRCWKVRLRKPTRMVRIEVPSTSIVPERRMLAFMVLALSTTTSKTLLSNREHGLYVLPTERAPSCHVLGNDVAWRSITSFRQPTWTLLAHPIPTPPHLKLLQHLNDVAWRSITSFRQPTWTLLAHPIPPHPTPCSDVAIETGRTSPRTRHSRQINMKTLRPTQDHMVKFTTVRSPERCRHQKHTQSTNSWSVFDWPANHCIYIIILYYFWGHDPEKHKWTQQMRV